MGTTAGPQDDARVRWSVHEGIGRITLSRPDRRNAIDPRFTDEFSDAVRGVVHNPDSRVVLLDAEGPHFSVGGDLGHLAGRIACLDTELGMMIAPFHAALGALAASRIPVVAAVQGACAGGALGIAWVADVVVASDDLRLAAGFAALGLSGDGAGSWHLPRLVGLRRAQELLIENRVLDAAEALEWGLVTRVVARDGLTSEAGATARRLADGPTRALGVLRGLLRTSGTTSLPDRYAEEAAAMSDLGGTADAREGVRAFVERRAPRFRGA